MTAILERKAELGSVVAIPIFRQSNNEPISEDILFRLSQRTNVGYLSSVQPTEDDRLAINELRKLSGLTWEQIAKLFDVSRRSLHLWASGKPLSSSHQEKLNRLLGTIRFIDRGSADLNRHLLLSNDRNGNLIIDLLTLDKHEEVKQLLGRGNAPERSQLKSLSEDECASRLPVFNPADLLDTKQEPIHQQIGKSRPARATRSRRNVGGQ